jgi:multidrug resistance efflux pump
MKRRAGLLAFIASASGPTACVDLTTVHAAVVQVDHPAGELRERLAEAVRVEDRRETTAIGVTHGTESQAVDVAAEVDGTIVRLGEKLEGVVSPGHLLFVLASDSRALARSSAEAAAERRRKAEWDLAQARQRGARPEARASLDASIREAVATEKTALAALTVARSAPTRPVEVPVTSPGLGRLVVAGDGFVLGRRVVRGEPVLQVVDALEIDVWLDVPEGSPAIAVGDDVELSLEKGTERTWSAVVDRLGGPQLRRAHVLLANPDRAIPVFTGVRAKVRGPVDAYSIVPVRAVRTDAGRSFVRVSRHPQPGSDDVEVTVGGDEPRGVAIRPALPRGAMVVLSSR